MNVVLYTSCFILAAIALLLSVILAWRKYKSKTAKVFKATYVMIVGTFIAGACIFFPICLETYREGFAPWIKAVVISLHSSIRLFIVDGEFTIVEDAMVNLPIWVATLYSFLAAGLFVLAPILTFSLILSLIRNALSYIKLPFSRYNALYVFSELNDETIELAGNIRELEKDNKDEDFTYKRRGKIVFTNVFKEGEESSVELMQEARELKAVCLIGDIESFEFKKRKNLTTMKFFIMGHDEDVNLRRALSLYDYYKDKENKNISIYVLARSKTSEQIISKLSVKDEKEESNNKGQKEKDEGKSRPFEIRRINPERALINSFFYTDPGNANPEKTDSEDKVDRAELRGWTGIFKGAIKIGDMHEIRILLVGLGTYGTEMLKTLVWFCQIEGYMVRIYAVDKNPNVKEMIETECPELLDKSGNTDPDSATYEIDIRPGIEVDSKQFKSLLLDYQPTFIFTALGDDDENIRASMKIRSMSEQFRLRRKKKEEEFYPQIVTVCMNPDISSKLQEMKSYIKKYEIQDKSGKTYKAYKKYNIQLIGSRSKLYSYHGIIKTDFEKVGLQIHKSYGGSEEEFYSIDYNYRSSIAAATHARAVLAFSSIAGEITAEALKMTKDEVLDDKIMCDRGRQEHRRWIAWTRAEGYAFGETRDDIAKTNQYLVGWEKLRQMEKEDKKQRGEEADTKATDTIDTALFNIRTALGETQTKDTCV